MWFERAPASILAALACLAIALLPEGVRAQLAWERSALVEGELWRLWTAHFVHFSGSHALTDAVVLFSVGALAETVAGTLTLALALLLAPPLMSLWLPALAPALSQYRGASGLAVMLAVIAGGGCWPLAGRWKAGIVLLATGFAGKTLFEAAGYRVGSEALPDGVAVAWQVHVMGAALGILVLATLGLFPHLRTRAGAPGLPERTG